MKYNLLCFQTSGRLIIFFNKHDYQVSTSLMKQNKRYKGLKTAKWISIWDLVPGLFLTVRSAGVLNGNKLVFHISEDDSEIKATNITILGLTTNYYLYFFS